MPCGLGPDTAGTPIVRFARSRVHLEEDVQCPARSGLLWLWKSITKGADRQAVDTELGLPLRYPGSINTVSGQMFTDPQSANHQVAVRLNGVLLDTLRFGPTSPNAPFRFELRPDQPARFEENRLGRILHAARQAGGVPLNMSFAADGRGNRPRQAGRRDRLQRQRSRRPALHRRRRLFPPGARGEGSL